MDNDRFLQCLDADYRRIRDIAASADLSAPVPSCPEWTVKDLVQHTAMVYLHKVKATELGREDMADWPPDLSGFDTPVAAFEDAYAQLTNMFATHDATDHSGTWYDGDQTVGFWIRRMAQETVIHRRDAELAVGDPTPADPELALDGIAELLDIFIAYPTHKWNAECQNFLAPADGDTVLVDASGTSWLARVTTAGVEIAHPADATTATVTVRGGPSDVLFRLWNRQTASDGPVDVRGEPPAVERFQAVLVACTQ
jgi:uncharacterized protein (TIGR03083 family)